MVRVHPTALAVRLSQRVATMAQCSTSASMKHAKACAVPVRGKKKKMYAVYANSEIRGKVLGQNL